MARVRMEAEHTLAQELGRAREEVDRSREAEVARIRRDAQEMLEAEAAAARKAAEEAAARALEAEVARVQREADEKLEAELARVRRDAEEARLAAARAESAAAERADATMNAARAAREAEARGALEAELASVRAEAERELSAELARVRAQAQAEANSLRHAAAQDARRTVEKAAAHTEEVEARAARAIEAERQRADAHIARRDRIDHFVAAGEATRVGICERRDRSAGRRGCSAAAAAAVIVIATGAALSVPPVRASALRIPGAVATQLTSLSRLGADAVRSSASTADAATVAAARPTIERRRGDAPAAAPPQRGPGLLTVSSRIPVDIYTRGRRIGASNSGEIVLASGTHRIELVNRRFNYRDEVSLEVAPGELTSYSVSLPYGSVRIETSPGAEIWIEGERVGEAPLSDVPVAIGTREVVVRHADRRERRQPVEVRRGEVSDRRCGLRAFCADRGCGGRNADARGSQPPHHQIGAAASHPHCVLRLAYGRIARAVRRDPCAVEWEAGPVVTRKRQAPKGRGRRCPLPRRLGRTSAPAPGRDLERTGS